jgi:hypothetical protein
MAAFRWLHHAGWLKVLHTPFKVVLGAASIPENDISANQDGTV